MGHITYDCLGLIGPNSLATLDGLRARIEAHYNLWELPHELFMVGDQLRLKLGDYQFYITHSDAPHVLVQSAELAEEHGHEDYFPADLKSCARRFEMQGDPDPNSEHFYDSCYVQECMEALGSVYIFDLQSGHFTTLFE